MAFALALALPRCLPLWCLAFAGAVELCDVDAPALDAVPVFARRCFFVVLAEALVPGCTLAVRLLATALEVLVAEALVPPELWPLEPVLAEPVLLEPALPEPCSAIVLAGLLPTLAFAIES